MIDEKYSQQISLLSNSEIGIILIHGFTSTTSSVQYLADRFYKHGFNVEVPSLSGHGTTHIELNKTKYKSWIDNVEKVFFKLQKRTKKIFIFGLSFGGTLALWLAENLSEINGIILVNHVIILKKDWRLPFLPIVRFLVSTTKEIANDIKDPRVKEIAYDRTPLQAMYQMMKLVKKVKKNLKLVKEPILIFKSKEDHLIPIRSAEYTLINISSINKKIVWLENSYHVATLDYDKDLIFEKSIKFIENI